MKNSIKKLFFTLGLFFIGFLVWAHKPPQISHYRFIQNKGQWNNTVLFKTAIGTGAFFLEKNGFTYNLIDPAFIHSFHADTQKEEILRKSSKKQGIRNFKGHAIKVSFKDALSPEVSGEDVLPEYFNYFLGKDPSKWVSKAAAYTVVLYKNIYPHTDLRFYTKDSQMKYDFIVHPGADISKIQLLYEGADKLQLEDNTLHISTSVGELQETKLYAYQQGSEGERSPVPCQFMLKGKTLSFDFPQAYDTSKPLIIDPVLIFSTYSGSYADNFGYTATYDAEGFLYSGSTVFNIGYPITPGAYDGTFNGYDTDIGISKYDTTGTFMVYSTLLGGTGDEMPHSLVVNSSGELYIFGTTGSANFPTTQGAYDTTFNNTLVSSRDKGRYMWALGALYPYGCDLFIARLSAGGSALEASTYLGGSLNDGLNRMVRDSLSYYGGSWYWSSSLTDNNSIDSLRYNYADEVRGEIDLDKNDNVYIATCTSSPDFPVTNQAFQQKHSGGGLDGIVVKMDSKLKTLLWSSFLGGKGLDAIYSIAISDSGNIYVAGGTTSKDFPVTNDVYQPVYAGGRSDGFVTGFDQDGASIFTSGYYGSPEYDQIYFVETDYRNYVYVLGQTEGKDSAFVYNVGYAVPNSGQFISKFSSALDSLKWSTAFGSGSGAPDISPTAFLVDVCRQIYLSGWGGAVNKMPFMWNNAGYTYNLPVTSNAFQKTTDGSDFYLMMIEDDASSLNYATFMGGDHANEHVDGGTSRFDKKGKIYQSVCAGCGGFSDFPIKPANAVSPMNNNDCNNAVFKFDFNLPIIIADFDIPTVGCRPFNLTITNRSQEQKATTYFWDFGDGTTSTSKTPAHTYTKAGYYKVKLLIRDLLSCNLIDSTFKNILIMSDTSYSFPAVHTCPDNAVQIGKLLTEPNVTFRWVPSTTLSDSTVSNPFATPPVTTKYTLIVDNGVCADTISQRVELNPVDLNSNPDSVVCSSDPDVLLVARGSGNPISFHWSSYPDFSDRLNADPSNPKVIVHPMLANNNYYLKAENQFGCVGFDTVEVLVNDYNLRLSGRDYLCLGDSTTLRVTGMLPDDSLSFNWLPHKGVKGRTDSSVLVVKPMVGTMYNVTVLNKKYGCRFVDSLFVDISPISFIDLTAWADKDTIFEGTSTILHVRPKGFNIDWTPAYSLNDASLADPVASPRKTTLYNVVLKDSRIDCRKDTSVQVFVIPVLCDEPNIFVPNAFTPNGDGKNDVLYVRGSFIEKINFMIYDRWGEKVFESNDVKKGWDGTFRKKELDPAVYAYYLEVDCIGGKKFFKKGNISLLR